LTSTAGGQSASAAIPIICRITWIRDQCEHESRLAVVAADLERDEGWPEAVAGCDYVIHVGSDLSSSIEQVTRLTNGMPGCPRLFFGVVDVRDVADLHLRAMTDPAAKGERFIAVSGGLMSMLDIATVLRARLGDAARKVPTRQLPNWLVRLISRFDPTLRPLVPLLDNTRHATSAKAERVLGWKPRPREDAIVATAESLVKFGIVT